MVMRRQIILLSWLVWFAGLAAWSDEPKFSIRQVSVNLPYITAYVDIAAENGQPPHLAASDISSITLQGRLLRVDRITLTHSMAYVLLLDVSGSIQNPKLIRNAVSGWIDTLSGDDRLEIFAVGDGYRQVANKDSSREAIKEELGKLGFYQQKTQLYSTLKLTLASLKRAEESSHEGHVVVVLTDGKDEGSNVSATDVQQEILQDHVPIYAIGYSQLLANEKERHLAELQSFAQHSGGFYDCAGALMPSNFCRQGASLQASFAAMKRTMSGIFIVTFQCDECRIGDSHELQIGLKSGATARYPVALAQDTLSRRGIPAWVYAAGALLLVIAVVTVLLLRKKPVPQPEVPPEAVLPPPPPPPPGFALRFTIVSGSEPGHLYTVNLAEKAVIGRDAGCDLVLPKDQEISGQHCELTRTGKRIEIVDLGSTNGTLVNGARLIGRTRLENGDLIRVGRTEFRVSFGES